MTSRRPSKDLRRIWAVGFTVVLFAAALLILLTKAIRTPASAMGFLEGDDKAASGTLTVLDGDRQVLTYVTGDRLPPGLGPEQARSCYIHPLYSLDGEVLTEDFPRDHLHHHGLFWTWPSVEVRGVSTQSWHPAEPSLRQHFVKWVEREVTDAGARLVVENTWKLGGTEDVAEETVTVLVHGASRYGRAIDIGIVLRPVGGPITLRGAAEEDKGYGGLCFRGRAVEGPDVPVFKGAVLTTDQGPLEADSVGRPFRWADLSAGGRLGGIAVFVSPDHPGFPLPWLVRTSYAGILNPCWPGLDTVVLEDGVPVYLRYRIYVHRGDVKTGRVAEAYQAYAAVRGL
jgi:hypothetical protein